MDVTLRFKWSSVVPRSHISTKFIQGMLDRMIQGAHKYGHSKAAMAAGVDCAASARLRLKKYQATGNTEWLMDAANFLMMEFMAKPDSYRPTIGGESPGYVMVDGRVSHERMSRSIDEPMTEAERHSQHEGD